MSRIRDDQPREARKRVPFSASSQKTQVEYKDPDFLKKWQPRWINDQRSRIQRALSASYEFVQADEVIGIGGQDLQSNTDQGSRVSMVVTGPVDGNPEVRAYLMKLRRGWYEEDQEAKRARMKDSQRAIREGRAGGVAVENVYGEVRTELKSEG